MTNTEARHRIKEPRSAQNNSERQGARWLVAYDIADAKRLQRLGRYMGQVAIRLQLSVYLVDPSLIPIQELVSNIEQIIDASEDDVRLYRLTSRSRMWGLGQQFENSDAMFVDQWLEKVTAPQQVVHSI